MCDCFWSNIIICYRPFPDDVTRTSVSSQHSWVHNDQPVQSDNQLQLRSCISVVKLTIKNPPSANGRVVAQIFVLTRAHLTCIRPPQSVEFFGTYRSLCDWWKAWTHKKTFLLTMPTCACRWRSVSVTYDVNKLITIHWAYFVSSLMVSLRVAWMDLNSVVSYHEFLAMAKNDAFHNIEFVQETEK
jgi:hypothetical protein